MILSEQTFIELAGKQEVLDAKIKAAKGIAELPLERIELAYRVEAAECVNEMKGDMKYWSDKPMNREAFLEEFVDALHFYLSYTNHIIENRPYFSGMNIHSAFDDLVGDFEANRYFIEGIPNGKAEYWELASAVLCAEEIEESFANLLTLVFCYNYTEQDIIDTYNKKNAVNHDRSDSGVY